MSGFGFKAAVGTFGKSASIALKLCSQWASLITKSNREVFDEVIGQLDEALNLKEFFKTDNLTLDQAGWAADYLMSLDQNGEALPIGRELFESAMILQDVVHFYPVENDQFRLPLGSELWSFVLKTLKKSLSSIPSAPMNISMVFGHPFSIASTLYSLGFSGNASCLVNAFENFQTKGGEFQSECLRFPFESSEILFELALSNEDEYFVRILHDGETLKICQEAEDLDGYCDWDSFDSLAQTFIVDNLLFVKKYVFCNYRGFFF